jgi:acyl carrier protein
LTKHGPAIREVLAQVTELEDPAALSDDEDLYRAGLTSLETLQVLIRLEERFGMTIPDEALDREIFTSITAIGDVIDRYLDAA